MIRHFLNVSTSKEIRRVVAPVDGVLKYSSFIVIIRVDKLITSQNDGDELFQHSKVDFFFSTRW